jgi:hypothetical protein
MKSLIEPMTIAHYDDAMALWKKAETIGLSGAETARFRIFLLT